MVTSQRRSQHDAANSYSVQLCNLESDTTTQMSLDTDWHQPSRAIEGRWWRLYRYWKMLAEIVLLHHHFHLSLGVLINVMTWRRILSFIILPWIPLLVTTSLCKISCCCWLLSVDDQPKCCTVQRLRKHSHSLTYNSHHLHTYHFYTRKKRQSVRFLWLCFSLWLLWHFKFM